MNEDTIMTRVLDMNTIPFHSMLWLCSDSQIRATMHSICISKLRLWYYKIVGSNLHENKS